MYHDYPYTDFHEANMDWFLSKFNSLLSEWSDMQKQFTSLDEAVKDLRDYVMNFFDSSDFRQLISDKLDEMEADGTLLALIAPHLPFVTPQLFGAVGDGVADDTQALSDCLHANQFVIIPRGFYRITNTVTAYCRDAVTVICDQKAIFIADGITDTMFEFCQYVGYSHIGASWRGGIFNMNGIANITGIKINQYCSFGTFRDIIVIDIGDGATGIDVNITSGKNYFDNIRIFGATFNIDIANPETNISVREYDLTRTNTGIRSNASYDYAIGNLDVMGCTIGILSEGSAQVDVGTYHYWIGTDGTTNRITNAQFLKTRAIKATNVGDNWHFNMFYPDKPYIGAEINVISCDNTHYICMPLNGIADGEDHYCYLASMLTPYGSVKFNNCDITTGNRIEYRGVNADYNAFRRGSVFIDNMYLQKYNYITPSLKINNYTENMPITYNTRSGYELIGYVSATLEGVCKLQIFTPSNAAVIDADILVKTYNGFISGKSYKGSQNINQYLALGNMTEINGTTWIPVYYYMEYSGTASSFQLYINVKGTLPFCLPVEYTYHEEDTVPYKYYIRNEQDKTIKTQQIISETVTIPVGVNTFTIPTPTAIPGYTFISDCFLDGYVDTSQECIVSIYRTTTGTVDVFNAGSESVTGKIYLKAIAVRNE